MSCKVCGNTEFYGGNNKKYPSQCKTCRNQIAQKYARKIRLDVLTHYSNSTLACACCNETEYKFLGIDHITGGGNKHRQEMKQSGITTYLWLKKNGFPTGYQVLCHNCNLTKGYYGQCPHIKY